MIPLLFGSSSRRLSGVYSAATGARQQRGAVLCPPFGQEMIRSHRTFRILASRLSDAGVDVLRFDYFGSGESAGEHEQLSVDGAIEDVEAAVEEIRDLAGVRKVTVVGMRGGALVAAMASADRSVDRLVLWDPVVEGARYVEQCLVSPGAVLDDGAVASRGFVYSRAFQERLRTLSVQAPAKLPAKLLYVVSQDDPAHRQAFKELSARVPEAEFVLIECPPAWTELGDLGVGSVPNEILDTIAGWRA